MANFDYSKLRHTIYNQISEEIRQKEKKETYSPNDKYNSTIFNGGMEWFNNGFSLEDAPEDIKKNTNFIRGFDRAKRLRDVERDLFNLGIEFYNDGLPLEQIPENYRNNPTVLSGYESAKKANITLDEETKKTISK